MSGLGVPILPGEGVVLDSCQVLNLFASRRMPEILRTVGLPVSVTEYTMYSEALWVGVGRRAAPNSEYEEVDLSPMIARGVLRAVRVETDAEASDFIRLATVMDDGEAMAGAIAANRNLIVGTDDRKAITIFGALNPPIATIGTCSIVYSWATQGGISPAEIKSVVRNIRRRARFSPPSGDVLGSWWNAALEEA